MCDGARVAGGDEGDGLGMRGHGSLGALVVQKSEEVCRERAHCALGKEKDSEDRTSPPRAQAARSPPGPASLAAPCATPPAPVLQAASRPMGAQARILILHNNNNNTAILPDRCRVCCSPRLCRAYQPGSVGRVYPRVSK